MWPVCQLLRDRYSVGVVDEASPIMRNRIKKNMSLTACWGNVVATKHLCQKSTQVNPPPHSFYVTDFASLDEANKRHEISYAHIFQDLTYKRYNINDIAIAREIFAVILEDWMYGYNTIYTEAHFNPLMLRILEFVSEKKVLQFLLPVFNANCSSIYKDDKGLGTHAHFAEFLAMCTLVETIRKIQEIYSHGIVVTIMAELQPPDGCHTLCIGDYGVYHNHMKEMINNIGAEDAIKLIDLEEAEKYDSTSDEMVVNDFIRISIHHHHPKTKKFPIDLYKKYNYNNSVRRMPCRHVVMYDTMQAKFLVDQKNRLENTNERTSPVVIVDYNCYQWLLIKLSYSTDKEEQLPRENEISVTMIKHGAGILMENKSRSKSYNCDIFHSKCLTSMIREFGVVILRGFTKSEEEMQVSDSMLPLPDLVCVLKMNATEPSVFELAPFMSNATGTFEWA